MDQIDEKIKYLVQQDKIVSPKAEKVINDFCYEKEIEKNTIKVPKKINFMYKVRKMIAIIACIAGLLGGANVYALTNGYGNVFFLIKYLVTGDKTEVTEKDELLSDRDITISYEPIALTENLKIQIRNLQIKDNKAKLIVAVNENIKTNITPLAYKVYNEENKLICEQKSSKKDNETDYIEELILNEFKNNDKLLYLEILNSKNEKLNKIIINLETREVTVEGEKEAIEKISEIELKDFLSYISAYEDGPKGDSIKIYIAEMFLRKKGQQSQYNKLDEVNNMLESIGYKKIKDNLIDDDVNIIVKNGEKYIELDNWGTFDTNTIIEIKDLKYSSGTYMANFTYTMLDNEEINLKGKMDNIDLKEATISFKMNEDKTYSTFKVIKYETTKENVADILIENNELIGSWEPSFAKENNQEISLRNIYGSGISGTMNFDSNGKYTAFIGNYSSEFEDDLQGDYINGRSSITLIAKSGKKEILTIKVIDGIKYLEKQNGITNQHVYFKKSASNNSNEYNIDNNIVKDLKLNIGAFSAKNIADNENNDDVISWINILENNKFEILRSLWNVYIYWKLYNQ